MRLIGFIFLDVQPSALTGLNMGKMNAMSPITSDGTASVMDFITKLKGVGVVKSAIGGLDEGMKRFLDLGYNMEYNVSVDSLLTVCSAY